MFFSWIAVLLGVLSAALVDPAGVPEFLDTHTVPRFPTAILCSGHLRDRRDRAGDRPSSSTSWPTCAARPSDSPTSISPARATRRDEDAAGPGPRALGRVPPQRDQAVRAAVLLRRAGPARAVQQGPRPRPRVAARACSSPRSSTRASPSSCCETFQATRRSSTSPSTSPNFDWAANNGVQMVTFKDLARWRQRRRLGVHDR